METEFWFSKWQNNDIGFHENIVNPFLLTHFNKLSLRKGSRVFVPLCGKTLDIAWLLAQEYRVVGAELVEIAIKQLFAELRVEPKISAVGKLTLYSANNLDIFVGDIFNLTAKQLGPVDAIYDRAALVALPKPLRQRYCKHLINITDNASQLLVTFQYDQQLMEGPPFSVSNAEVEEHYRNSYDLTLLESTKVAAGLKGISNVVENVWLLCRNRM